MSDHGRTSWSKVKINRNKKISEDIKMFKAFSDSTLRQMAEGGRVEVRVKDGWQRGDMQWQSTPCFITFNYVGQEERIYSGYLSVEGDTIQITNIERAGILKENNNKALRDAYMYVMLAGIIKHVKGLGKKRLVLDSYEPSIVDHGVDLGYAVTTKGAGLGGRCLKNLEDE